MIAPRVCFTAGGLVIQNSKILLVRHKKLGIWLAPGGHIEDLEMPHQAALREVLEETGIQCEIMSASSLPLGTDSEYQPTPLMANLHWVASENYQARSKSKNPTKLHATEKWKRGCEQHLVWLYVMRPINNDQTVIMNQAESTEIGWFSAEEVGSLPTTDDIRAELQFALQWSEP